MKGKKIKLDEKRVKMLKRISNPDYNLNQRVAKKAQVILLAHKGKRIKEIMKETNLNKRTIINYTNEYINPDPNIGGMHFIHRNDYKKSSLKDVKGLLEEFKNKSPESYKEATQRIKKLYNISISESAVRRFLNKKDIYTKNNKTNK